MIILNLVSEYSNISILRSLILLFVLSAGSCLWWLTFHLFCDFFFKFCNHVLQKFTCRNSLKSWFKMFSSRDLFLYARCLEVQPIQWHFRLNFLWIPRRAWFLSPNSCDCGVEIRNFLDKCVSSLHPELRQKQTVSLQLPLCSGHFFSTLKGEPALFKSLWSDLYPPQTQPLSAHAKVWPIKVWLTIQMPPGKGQFQNSFIRLDSHSPIVSNLV